MFIDKAVEYGVSQVVTVAAPSTDYYNQRAPGDAARPNNLVIQVDEDVDAAGAATVEAILQTATDSAFTTPVQLWSSGPMAKADLVAGTEMGKLPLPRGLLQYRRIYFDVQNGPLTDGKFSAFETPYVDHDNT